MVRNGFEDDSTAVHNSRTCSIPAIPASVMHAWEQGSTVQMDEVDLRSARQAPTLPRYRSARELARARASVYRQLAKVTEKHAAVSAAQCKAQVAADRLTAQLHICQAQLEHLAGQLTALDAELTRP